MPSVFITGCNRGIGLEYVRQYGEAGWRVYASCRHPGDAYALRDLAGSMDNVSLHRLDVTSLEDVRATHWEMEGKSVDVLISNAGIYLEKGALKQGVPAIGALRYEDWSRTLEVNTLGSIRVVEALVENVAQSDRRLVAVMSSHMGSIGDITEPGSYYYRSSKAALNAAMQGLSVALEEKGVGVLLLHPGGVDTRMGPRTDPIPVRESVQGLRERIDGFEMSQTGRFYRYDGTELPW